MTSIAKLSQKQEIETIREKLEKLILDYSKTATSPNTAVPNLSMAMTTMPIGPLALIYEPSLCICVRGRKKLLLGKETLYYDEDSFLLTCIGIPTIVSIAKASEQNPYSGLLINLNMEMVRSIISEMENAPPPTEASETGVMIKPVTLSILEPVYRLASLQFNKQDIGIMAPIIQREILYRLLSGPCGDYLRRFALHGSQTNRLSKAVAWIRENYQKKLSIENLASIANMGVSTFHRQFLDLTTMSPIQYQKHLRLHEAKRLMIAEDMDAASSAIQVGYESVTQFNREYRRLFGAPPAADKRKLLKSDQPPPETWFNEAI